MPNQVSDVNNLLDSLYLELLDLIEQHTECRINIERISKYCLIHTNWFEL